MASSASIQNSKRRRFQTPITSFFNAATSPQPADQPGLRRNFDGSTSYLQSSLASSAAATSAQPSLLTVGMRIRKSVAEGYKTHKTIKPSMPETVTSTSRITTYSGGGDLEPLCGLSIHKVGGLAIQAQPRPYRQTQGDGIQSAAVIEDGGGGGGGGGGMHSPPSSQESTSTVAVENGHGNNLPLRPSKRRFDIFEEDGANQKHHEASYPQPPNTAPFLSPTSSSSSSYNNPSRRHHHLSSATLSAARPRCKNTETPSSIGKENNPSSFHTTDPDLDFSDTDADAAFLMPRSTFHRDFTSPSTSRLGPGLGLASVLDDEMDQD